MMRLRYGVSSPHAGDERGDAVIEFIGFTIAIFIPLLYLIVTISGIQAAAFATESGAREAARLLSADYRDWDGAREAVRLTFSDQGIKASEDALEIECQGVCKPGSVAHIRVRTRVDLPLLPPFLARALPLQVPVSAAIFVELVPQARSI